MVAWVVGEDNITGYTDRGKPHCGDMVDRIAGNGKIAQVVGGRPHCRQWERTASQVMHYRWYIAGDALRVMHCGWCIAGDALRVIHCRWWGKTALQVVGGDRIAGGAPRCRRLRLLGIIIMVFDWCWVTMYSGVYVNNDTGLIKPSV